MEEQFSREIGWEQMGVAWLLPGGGRPGRDRLAGLQGTDVNVATPGLRIGCAHEDEPTHLPPRRDDWDREPAHGVSDQHDVAEPASHLNDQIGILRSTGLEILGWQVYRNALAPQSSELWDEEVERPGPLLATMNEDERRWHRRGRYLEPWSVT